MNTDLSFITNEKNQSLKDRFEVLIKDTSFFDCLVGYFYTSGFHALYKSLKKTEKIRILIGISTDRQTYDLIIKARNPKQQAIEFSHAEAKKEIEKLVEQEFADSEDNRKVEEGVNKFIEWVRDRKLEIRAYPSQNIHAKLYIMTFCEGDRDLGQAQAPASETSNENLCPLCGGKMVLHIAKNRSHEGGNVLGLLRYLEVPGDQARIR